MLGGYAAKKCRHNGKKRVSSVGGRLEVQRLQQVMLLLQRRRCTSQKFSQDS